MARKLCTYTYEGAGVDSDGWYKYSLRNNSTGNITQVPRKRYRDLVKAGRVINVTPARKEQA